MLFTCLKCRKNRPLFPISVGLLLTVHEINSRNLATDILVDLSPNTIEPVLNLLLDNRSVQVSSQKDFLVLRRIGVIGRALSGDEGIDLTDHETSNKWKQ